MAGLVRIRSSDQKRLRPIHPSAGLQIAYQRRLDRLIREMNRSLFYWLRAAYRNNTPEIAQDASPARAILAAFRRVARRVQSTFNEAAAKLAGWFTASSKRHTDAAMKQSLKQAGYTVEFKLTPAMNDVLQATIAQNVSLIKSIASQHLTDVEGLVMRAVQSGYDLKTLSDELEKRFQLPRHRAELIARDQTSKANSALVRLRQIESGIKKAQWLHSGAGHHPRPGHVKASRDKLIYDVAKGAFIDNEYIFPGQLINCRCVSIPVI
jgi:uncharacterized protein with gpF-like domain